MTNPAENNIEPSHTALQVKGSSMNHHAMYFYQNDHLSAQISEQGHRCVLWAKETPTAQLGEEQTAKILKVDQASSVLGVAFYMAAYSPYGFLEAKKNAALIAFNGQCLDQSSHAYVLGSGYRLFSPVLMRFKSPDSLSPFDWGGLNAYAYCENDPINFSDPSGHTKHLRGVQRAINSRNSANNYKNDMHPTKLPENKSALNDRVKDLKRGIKRDTRDLVQQRKELPALEQAATKAERNNINLVADPNDWADKKRTQIMNNRNYLEVQKANGKLLAAQNNEKFLSINITKQTSELTKIENELHEIREHVRSGRK